jgi:murein DD-endopeptidase MepM/ murein hydrolase activator NlpD
MLPISERSVLGASLPALQKAAQPILAKDPDITSEYGFRKNPFTRKLEYHGGIDLAASSGTGIYPALPGTVKFSGWQSGYGNVVIVDHGNGLDTLYAHNSSNKVQAGQTVKANTLLGKVGSTGDSTGPHVHFEVHVAGKPVNPTTLVSRRSLQIAKAL